MSRHLGESMQSWPLVCFRTRPRVAVYNIGMTRRHHVDTKAFDEIVAANVAHLISLRSLKDRSVSKKSVARQMGVSPDVFSRLLHQDQDRARRWLAAEMFQAARVLGVSLDRLARPLKDD